MSLAKKLAKGAQKQKLRGEADSVVPVVPIEDIEDTFSPIQTRHQRKIKGTIVKGVSTYFSPLQTHKRNIHDSKMPKKQILYKKLSEVNVKETQIVDLNKNVPLLLQDEEEQSLKSASWKPKDWQKVLANIRQMRQTNTAPVDTMGCHQCADEDADEKTQRYHKLIALMLSSQTKDETTFEAMKRLKENSLTPQNIDAMKPEKLQSLLYPVSFYKNKAKYMQQVARILIDKYESDIPRTVQQLVALPGVGPKMAHICMATAWNETTGIGVDVHVHRITNRLHWLPSTTKEPEQTRIALEKWIPKDLWREVNHLLVGFGQTVCTPVRPHCNVCLNRNICPSVEKFGKREVTTPGQILSPVKKTKTQKKKTA